MQFLEFLTVDAKFLLASNFISSDFLLHNTWIVRLVKVGRNAHVAMTKCGKLVGLERSKIVFILVSN